MKVYLVSRTDRVDYDEYDSWVVVAENEERAKEMCKDWGSYDYMHNNKKQPPVEVYEIKLDKECFVLGSFNAG
jgi:hypothetical protein